MKGRLEARDGRVADAGRVICRHISLLSSAPPKAVKVLENGAAELKGTGGKAGKLASAGAGIKTPDKAVSGSGIGEGGKGRNSLDAEVELKASELSRVGSEVSVDSEGLGLLWFTGVKEDCPSCWPADAFRGT